MVMLPEEFVTGKRNSKPQVAEGRADMGIASLDWVTTNPGSELVRIHFG